MSWHYLILTCLIYVPQANTKKTTDVTLNVEQRVNALKQQIIRQIGGGKGRSHLMAPIDDDDYYQYEEVGRITPIMDDDERKKNEKFKLPKIKTTPERPLEETISAALRTETPRRPTKRGRRKKKALRERTSKMADLFYRRIPSCNSYNPDNCNIPVESVHCQDLITPFFDGLKTNPATRKRILVTDPKVKRFIQLLTLNTTGYTNEELYSVLYQISNLNLRFFQWDLLAVSHLIGAIVKNKEHTFRNVVYGVRDLLSNWHLDLGNTTNLLKQARIFRPPCAPMYQEPGSTKTSPVIRYKKLTDRVQCNPSSEECDL